MGLIKTTQQTYVREYIKCANLSNDILMKVIRPVTLGVINKTSAIVVDFNQMAVVLQNGIVVGVAPESGIYMLDSDIEAHEVVYINAKEIIYNKFGTTKPIPYKDFSASVTEHLIKCYGKYTFKIVDPMLFVTKFGIWEECHKDRFVEKNRTEIVSLFQNVLSELGNPYYRVPVLELPNNTDNIRKILSEKNFVNPISELGIKVLSFTVEEVTIAKENVQMELNLNNDQTNNLESQTIISKPTVNFCTKCGAQSNGANFCTKCGNKLI